MLKVIFDAKAKRVSASRCIGRLATNGIATVSACDLTAVISCGHTLMQHVCLLICSLTHVLIALDLLLEQWDNWLPSKKNRMIDPGKTPFKKLKMLFDRMMLRRTKVCFFSNLTIDSLPEGCWVQRADDLGLPPRTIVFAVITSVARRRRSIYLYMTMCRDNSALMLIREPCSTVCQTDFIQSNNQ